MKHLSRLLFGNFVCFALTYSAASAEPDRAFLSKTIKATLTEPSDVFVAKHGRRGIRLKRLATSACEMRLALWTLMGEPVQTYKFRMPRVRELIFEAEDGYANRVTISSVGESKENETSYHGGSTVYVSQDLMDKIEYVDFSFSIETYDLHRLPADLRTEGDSPVNESRFKAYIQMNNQGVLKSPGKWGWDTPGSPQWDEFLSKYEDSLEEGKTRLPKRHYMDKQKAKEAFRRMRWRYHKDKANVFVNNWFEIHHLRVNPDRLLNQIYEQSPEAYAKIMERE